MSARQRQLAFGLVLLLIVGAGAFLWRLQGSHALGKPGLRMIRQPVYDETGAVVNEETVALPERVLDYESKALPVAKAELGWLPKDTTYAKRGYRSPTRFELMLNVVLMGTDRTSIHKPEDCLPAQGFSVDKTRTEVLRIPLKGARPFELPVMKLEATRLVRLVDGRQQPLKAVYIYWFVADGHVTAHHGERMWLMARELLRTGELQRWAYVSCLAVCAPGGEAAALEKLKEFIAAAVPQFQNGAGTL